MSIKLIRPSCRPGNRPAPCRPLTLFTPALLLALVLLAACGNPGPAAGRESPVIGHALRYDTALPVNGGRPIIITFWTQINQQAVYEHLIADYQQIHPNVTVQLVTSSYGDHFARLKTALQAGMGPDLFHMHNEFAETFRDFLAPYPTDRFPLEAMEKDFLQVSSHVTDSRLHFIDTGLMTSRIYYNTRMWHMAGLGPADIPRTWEDLRRVARKLTVRGSDGRILRAGFNPNGIGADLFTALNLQQGQTLFMPDNPARPIIGGPAATRSLAFIRSLYGPDGVCDVRLPQFHEALGSQKAAMIYAWGWASSWLDTNFPDLEYGVFPLPSWDGTVPPAWDRNNGECSMGVNKAARAERKAVAFDLVCFFLASDKYLAEICKSLDIAPSKLSLDANDAQSSEIIRRTVWPGPLPSFYNKTLSDDLIDPVIIDGADPQASLAATRNRLERLFAASAFRSVENRYSWKPPREK